MSDATPATEPEVERLIPLTPIRRITMDNLVESVRESARAAQLMEMEATGVEQAKAAWQAAVSPAGPRISLTTLLVKAVTLALARHRELNCALRERDIVLFKDINVGVAVALPEGNLIVPVVHHADRLGVPEIAARIAELAERARVKRLKREDVLGGTFTVSNFGMFGKGGLGLAVIPRGQAAVLTVGGVMRKPVAVDDRVLIRPVLPVSLTFDHRIVNGVPACTFMATLADTLESGRLLAPPRTTLPGDGDS